jgi:hypothetical protein
VILDYPITLLNLTDDVASNGYDDSEWMWKEEVPILMQCHSVFLEWLRKTRNSPLPVTIAGPLVVTRTQELPNIKHLLATSGYYSER